METCQRCGKDGDDRRTLWMRCFYAMNELRVPFVERKDGDGAAFFTLRVCKDCRADWLGAIETWFNAKPQQDEDKQTGTGVFVRENGATRELTVEEVQARYRLN